MVKRYEIGGYDRELHGALLDSQILGDVYLSMTGGQSALDFSDNLADQGSDERTEAATPNSSLKLRVIELTQEEQKLHLEYLSRMKDETGTDPLGLK